MVVWLPRFYDENAITFHMGVRDWWRRFNQWAENLSRIGYALFAVLVASLVAGATSFLLSGEIVVSSVIGAAIGLGLVSYVWGPP